MKQAPPLPGLDCSSVVRGMIHSSDSISGSGSAIFSCSFSCTFGLVVSVETLGFVGSGAGTTFSGDGGFLTGFTGDGDFLVFVEWNTCPISRHSP